MLRLKGDCDYAARTLELRSACAETEVDCLTLRPYVKNNTTKVEALTLGSLYN